MNDTNFEIVLNNVKKVYSNSKVALEDINLNILKESIFCLLGPNGAGKTTMVRLLNGILKPTSGDIYIFNQSPTEANKEIRLRCGVVTESSNCYENMSGFENLKFYGQMYNLDKIELEERIGCLVKKLNMNEYINNLVKEYSTGMRKKIMLAISLINNPDILFLDEPTASLDPESSREILNFINFLVENNSITVFICTHQLNYAEKIGTSFCFINNGKIVKIIEKNSESKINFDQKGWLEELYFSIIN